MTLEPNRIREEKLLAKIAKGQKITELAEMSDEYREHLTNLMSMQADSELAGAFGYVPWIQKAPDINETLVVAQIVKDEVRHATVMYRLLKGMGVDVDHYYKTHNFNLRVDADDIGTLRAADDKRVNIFYYPIETWSVRYGHRRRAASRRTANVHAPGAGFVLKCAIAVVSRHTCHAGLRSARFQSAAERAFYRPRLSACQVPILCKDDPLSARCRLRIFGLT